MTAYTNVAKPVGTPYTNVNPQGQQEYDDPTITYDSATNYYDSINVNAYNSVAKPTGTPYTNIAKPIT